MNLTPQAEILNAHPEDYVVLAYVTDRAGLVALLGHEGDEGVGAPASHEPALVTFRTPMGMASATPGHVCYVAVKRRYLAEGQPAGCWWCSRSAPYTLVHRALGALAA